MLGNTSPAWVRFGVGRLSGALLVVVMSVSVVLADGYRTPRAGDGFSTVVLGEAVTVPPRDRCNVTALNLGVQWVEDAPSDYEVLPFGALFLWRNKDGGRQRLRAVLAGFYNEVRYHLSPDRLGKTELVVTLDSMTVPMARQEFVEGRRIDQEELEWHRLHFGFGFGWRTPLAPGHQDNALEVALTYEPGFLWFSDGGDTAGDFRQPRDTYEGRVHFRLRADALERNVMELPHAGWAAGVDGFYGHRARWDDWGGGRFSAWQSGADHDTWIAGRFHALAALPLPWTSSERHRLVASVFAGMGEDLDRFSAFRLGGEPGGGEWEALSRPNLLGAMFDEFYSRGYAIANLEYRSELLFFCYLHLRGQLAWIDRPRIRHGSLDWESDMLPAVNVAVTCGAPWNSQLELGFNHNFGLLREDGITSGYGGSSMSLAWSKEF
ncbi:hypothetical protein [Syntrophotalea acetylenica]|uniref:hypothetical protein n=1 Tax=Syntrophotalea acetylenica TaxID=29542 RepID=UPI000A751470|nr:hypothetical protein [Syntrophotalea acetylenica]